MPRLLRSVIVATLAVVLTGSASVAFALADGRQPDCRATQCQETTLKCVCCPDSSPAGTTPTTNPAAAKLQVPADAVAASPVAVLVVSHAVSTESTHRAGPPRSLSILHATLLI